MSETGSLELYRLGIGYLCTRMGVEAVARSWGLPVWYVQRVFDDYRRVI